MNKIKFYEKDNINLIDVIQRFTRFISDNKDGVKTLEDDNTNIEFEITIYTPDIIKTLSRIYSIDNQKECYIEKTVYKTKENIKYRSKLDFKEVGTSRIKNNTISSKGFNIWEEKRLIKKEYDKINDFSYDIKLSVERKKIKLPYTSNYLIEQNAVSLWIINSISFVYKNIRVSMKCKGMLGPGKENATNYMKYISNYTSIPKNTTWYIEFEVCDINKVDDIKILENNLIDCFSFVYGVSNIFNISISKNIIPNILKTNFITFKDLIQQDEKNILITPKADGEKVEFKVKNGLCYMILNNIIYTLQTRISKKYKIIGVGEYVRLVNKKVLYPFYIYSINNKIMKNREKSLVLLKKILKDETPDVSKLSDAISNDIVVDSESYLHNQSNLQDLEIEYKDIRGPFENKENMMESIYELLTLNTEYEKDGIVIMNKENNNQPMDEKFKLDNTIDILAHIKPNLTLKPDGINIEIDLIKFPSRSNSELFKKIYIKYSKESFYLDEVMSFAVIKNIKTKSPPFYVVPHTLIYEYSLLFNRLVQPRYIKTNNYFYHGYTGNSYDVISRSEDVHSMNKIPPIETFKELGKSFDLTKIYNLSDQSYLNADKTKYFIESSKRTALNFITNFIKTQSTMNSYSPMVTSKTEPYNKTNKNYLLIDIGRGGDLMKYFYVNANSLTGTDPSVNALDECRKRHSEQTKKSRSSLFKLNLSKAYFNDKDYVSIVNSHGIGKFTGIDWNMAIHYSWKRNKRLEIIRKLGTLIVDGGKIVITTLDGTRILDMMDQLATDKLDFVIDNINIKFILSKDPEGNLINKVFIPSMTSESQDEYIIDIDDLIEVFESNKFMLLEYYHFNLIKTYQDIFQPLTVTRNNKEESRYHFFKSLTTSNVKEGSDLDKLCSLYVSLIFEKI